MIEGFCSRPVFVGLESCVDIWATLKSLESLNDLSNRTRSGLKKELRLAVAGLKADRGDEIPVDGRDLDVLIQELEQISTLETSIGGGGAIQTSQLLSLGAEPYFVGSYSKRQIAGSPFSRANFDLAMVNDGYPVSIILQLAGDRFILCEGRGRRIDDLLDHIKTLPKKLKSAPRPAAISLSGWHVLFGLGVEDAQVNEVVRALGSIREIKFPLATDTGGFGRMSDFEIRRLWRIYRMFDVLSTNEIEFQRLCSVMGLSGDENSIMYGLMSLGGNIGTLWLHKREYQKSISRMFSHDRLAFAQEFASAAGCLRVETGRFPQRTEIYSKAGPGRSLVVDGVVMTRGIRAGQFKTEVGAGDVSFASFLYSLLL